MADKTLKTRIKLKCDTLENWNINNTQLLEGEIAVVLVPTGTSQTTGSISVPQILFKVGAYKYSNGVKTSTLCTFKELPWASGLAADVYSWAKAENKPTYSYNEITGTPDIPADTNTNYKIEADTNDGHKFYLKSCEKGANTWTTVSTITIPDNDTKDFTVTATAKSDGVIILTGTEGVNGVTYEAKHALSERGSGSCSNMTETITADQNYFLLPQFTVDLYGHISQFEDTKVFVDIPTTLKNPNALNVTIGSTTTTYDGSEAKTVNITAADLGLSAAMKFIGKTETDIKDGSETNPITIGTVSTTATAGNVVLYGAKEFVWTGTVWAELGDGGSYALNSIKIEGGDGLTGGGNLESNRAINHAVPTGATAGARGNTAARTYIKTVTTDKFGHVTGVETGSETVTNTAHNHAAGEGLSITGSGGITGTTTYTLKAAATGEVGGIKVSSVNTSAVSVNTETTTAGRYYPIELNNDAKAIVNIPWTDTKVTSVDNHYTPAENADSQLNASAAGTTAAVWDSTKLVTGVHILRDAKGHVTDVKVDGVTMPANPNVNANNAALKGIDGVAIFTANASEDCTITVIDCGTSSTVI